jgi:hypothetical protein
MLQPTQPGVVNAASEFIFIMDLIGTIQNELSATHRFLADVWMGSAAGAEWITRYRKSSVRRREKILPTLSEIASVFNFTVKDIKLLWYSISFAVNPSYWEPAEWGPNSLFGDSVFRQLRDASYQMIALFLKAAAYSPGSATGNLSNDSKVLILFNSSDSNNLTSWPHLPDMPPKPRHWLKKSPFYHSNKDHHAYKDFEIKMRHLGNMPNPEPVEVISSDDEDEIVADPPEEAPPSQSQDRTSDTKQASGDTQATEVTKESQVQVIQSSPIAQAVDMGMPESQEPEKITIPESVGKASPDKENLHGKELLEEDSAREDTAQEIDDAQSNSDSDREYTSQDEDQERQRLEKFDIDLPIQFGLESSLLTHETMHAIQDRITFEDSQDTAMAALMLQQADSVWEATARGLTMGRMGPLAHGLYAIEAIHQCNARSRAVIAYEHRKITSNNEIIEHIKREMEEAAINRAIYEDLKTKYASSGRELSSVRQKNEKDNQNRHSFTPTPAPSKKSSGTPLHHAEQHHLPLASLLRLDHQPKPLCLGLWAPRRFCIGALRQVVMLLCRRLVKMRMMMILLPRHLISDLDTVCTLLRMCFACIKMNMGFACIAMNLCLAYDMMMMRFVVTACVWACTC